tara:strand:- start:95 stop:658 length:564 start_codon:yes stop_codon:yes gene_type:complete
MKQHILIALTCLSINSFSQTKNYYIVINDSSAIGMYSTRSGLTFTEDLEEEVMSNIKDNFENEKEYSVNVKWDLEDFFFEEEYYSYDSNGSFLGLFSTKSILIEIEDKSFNEEPLSENYLERTSDMYLLSEGIAIAGTALSLALSQDDPVAAASVLAVTSIVSYCIRISGHISLRKQEVHHHHQQSK